MKGKWATETETEKYFKWNPIEETKLRKFDLLSVSAIGIGNYLGNADDAADKLYEETLLKAMLSGINFFDTSINYRAMRSERNLGRAIKEAMARGVTRDQIVISTKGGYIPHEGNSYEEYVRKTFLDTGVIETKDIVREFHCITKGFLDNQIHMSLKNLDLECIDLYYLYNPETQMQEVSEDEFYQRLGDAFNLLEEKVKEQKIRRYGLATWNGFRMKKGGLDFERIIALAKDAGGEEHHFKAIQVPYNLVMMEIIKQDFIEIANEHNISIMISAPLMQGKVTQVSNHVFEALPEGRSKANQALEFILSSPGLSTTFCGMKQLKHIEENTSLLHTPAWSKEVWYEACATLGVEPAKKD